MVYTFDCIVSTINQYNNKMATIKLHNKSKLEKLCDSVSITRARIRHGKMNGNTTQILCNEDLLKDLLERLVEEIQTNYTNDKIDSL